ncbi:MULTISPECIES: hypothetical protein [Pseudomonas]|uniref:hypothetical protein n=1 Tax=Pseudomonas TaxID=286 RepID=UPI00047115EE|nr:MULTISPECIES: hypothetical protein [Pseudomonas]AZC47817.1 hypothetical protein C4K35_0203 [Pseudomonas chlororaphis subsp. piscium]AZC54398.1 hypothetical protein C4K34_0202 [Pseudomonas chlororaphis subsp. piscium]AZC66896.1 hypothetical protein C4K32_0203 [Pseudomonas chlororaphis subsp. piscium]AZC73135.1 hypothetical protein C4K31_0201 [Pseudomonas chlororaphis subsp. piscium]AZC79347.1 hypothetical protein C4K30_0202 [Pseudomonas chlororaphis subsp. piscium]
MPQENADSLASLYQLADALNLSLSAGEKQILEAWMRSEPRTGVMERVLNQTQHLIENERQRTRDLMEQARVSESSLLGSPQQREAVIRQWLAAKQQATVIDAQEEPVRMLSSAQNQLIRQTVEEAVQARMLGLVQQVEAVLSRIDQAGDAPEDH